MDLVDTRLIKKDLGEEKLRQLSVLLRNAGFVAYLYTSLSIRSELIVNGEQDRFEDFMVEHPEFLDVEEYKKWDAAQRAKFKPTAPSLTPDTFKIQLEKLKTTWLQTQKEVGRRESLRAQQTHQPKIIKRVDHVDLDRGLKNA